MPTHRRGQVALGRKVVKETETNHLREAEAIARMRDLRAQEYSYHKIADVFNAMGVPTKTRKARWHATTVMNILKSLEAIPTALTSGHELDSQI